MGKKQKLRCQHDNTYFDRTLCAEPCGDMHTTCNDCGYIFGGCAHLNRDAEPKELTKADPIRTTIMIDGQEFSGLVDRQVQAQSGELSDLLRLLASAPPQQSPSSYEMSEESYQAVFDDCVMPRAYAPLGSYQISGEVPAYSDNALAEWEKELLDNCVTTQAKTRPLTTHADISLEIDNTLVEILELNNTKGREYATEEDGLANFKNRAKQMGITPGQVWGIFYGKHSDAIFSYLKGGKALSEPIQGRIDDAILYLILLKALITEGSA